MVMAARECSPGVHGRAVVEAKKDKGMKNPPPFSRSLPRLSKKRERERERERESDARVGRRLR
jgi:hypothetical protein